MTKKVFAIGAHPDDIEFMMSGTLMLLKDRGCEIHYMNIANGSCGTGALGRNDIIEIRRKEAINAAESIGAVYHESLVNDIEIFYEKDLLFKLGSIMREVAPEIVLTHSYFEYMEDHSNTCRLVVTAAFCRGMKNFPVALSREITEQDVTIYHALPYGLLDPLGRNINAGIYVDIGDVIKNKKKMLAWHKSQKEWLDASQGLDSYLTTMSDLCRKMGEMSGKFTYAEGWIRHLPLGMCSPDANPLVTALGNNVLQKPIS